MEEVDPQLVGAIAAIGLARGQGMLSDSDGALLISAFMRTHGLPTDDVVLGKWVANHRDLTQYIARIKETNTYDACQRDDRNRSTCKSEK